MIKTFCDVCGQGLKIGIDDFMSEKIRHIDRFLVCQKCCASINFDKFDDEKTAFFKAYCQSHRKAARKSTAKTAPATLEQAIDENAERRLAELDKRRAADKTPCHCHRIGEKRRTVETFAKKVLMRKLPKTLKEVAVYTDTDYKKVHKYAYTHNIGKAGHTLDGHQCRILSEADVKALIEHFKK